MLFVSAYMILFEPQVWLITHQTVNKLTEIECQVTTETSKHSDEIKVITDEIGEVATKLMNIEGDLKELKNEEVYIRKKMKKKLIQCDYCDKKLGSVIALEEHMKEEHASCTFNCNECDLAYYSEWRLKKHLKSHGKENMRHCYYFNSNKMCPFEELGCKFLHKYSAVCKNGDQCSSHMCQFKHWLC